MGPVELEAEHIHILLYGTSIALPFWESIVCFLGLKGKDNESKLY